MAKIKIKIGETEHEVPVSELKPQLTEAGLDVFTKEEFNSKFGELHGVYETAFKEATGLQKPEGMKGSDWIKQQAKTLFDQTGSSKQEKEALTAQIEELKTKLKDGIKDDTLKAENEKLLKALEDRKTEIETIKGAHQKELSTYKSKVAINQRLAAFEAKLKEGTDKNAIAYKRSLIFDQAMKNGVSELEDGRLVVLNEHGTALTDNEHNVITVDELISREFSDYIDKEKKGKGTGGTGSSGGGSGAEPLPDTVKTMIDFQNFLKEKNISPFSKEGIALRNEAKTKKLPLR